MPGLDADSRGRLLAGKLRGILRSRGLDAADEPVALAGGAAVVVGDTAHVLVHDDAERGLGMTLAWSTRRGASRAVCIVDVDGDGRSRPVAGVLARRRAGLRGGVEVWRVDGARVDEADPAPLPPPGPYPVGPGVEPFLPAAAVAGVEVVPHADGSATFEVLGLEVGRVVAGPGGGRLEVGVGRHDRDAMAELHDGDPPAEALRHTAETVRRLRRPGAQVGPANLLQRERWLRGEIGVEPLPEPSFARDLRRPRPAAGLDGDTLVVCSAGVDLDLVPAAADAWLVVADRVSSVRLVVPEGDDKAITRDLAGRLRVPAEVVAVRPPWT